MGGPSKPFKAPCHPRWRRRDSNPQQDCLQNSCSANWSYTPKKCGSRDLNPELVLGRHPCSPATLLPLVRKVGFEPTTSTLATSRSEPSELLPLVPPVGLPPTTHGLKVHCSLIVELRRIEPGAGFEPTTRGLQNRPSDQPELSRLNVMYVTACLLTCFEPGAGFEPTTSPIPRGRSDH